MENVRENGARKEAVMETRQKAVRECFSFGQPTQGYHRRREVILSVLREDNMMPGASLARPREHSKVSSVMIPPQQDQWHSGADGVAGRK